MKNLRSIFIFCLILVLSIILIGCSNHKKQVKTLNIYLPGEYLDLKLVDEFEKESDINVIIETFENNEDMIVKLEKGDNDYDIIIPSDYMIEKMKKKDMLLPLDFSKIPNYKYIDEEFKNKHFDPNNEYSVPYFWGYVGILYNKKFVDEKDVNSWKILFDKKYDGKILMLNSYRDSMMIALKYLGYSMNTINKNEIDEAKELLIKQKPMVMAYGLDDIRDEMLTESAWILPTYNGEIIDIGKYNENLALSIPKEGTNLWIDSFVILKNSKNIDEAYKFINFILEPKHNAQNAKFVGYSIPSKEAVKFLDDSIKNNDKAYPNMSELKQCEEFIDLGDNIELYNKAWTYLKAN